MPDPSDDTQVVKVIPARLQRKEDLLNTYARLLEFPEYFGGNWDAFHDVFPDWDRHPEISEITIVHQDLPLADDPENLKIYLDILSEATKEAPTGKVLRISFPESAQTPIEYLMCEAAAAH